MSRIRRSQTRRRQRWEWPTLAVAAVIYGGWIVLTLWHRTIPVPLLALAGGWLIAWHGSLQHEVIHRHPTGRRAIDDAIGFPPLALWLPYAIYRRSHIAHHRSHWITHPAADPESRYLESDAGPAGIVARLQGTLVLRLLLGPMLAIGSLVLAEWRRLRGDGRAVARDWLPHLAGCAIVLGWLAWNDFGIVRYLLLFVYPGPAFQRRRAARSSSAGEPSYRNYGEIARRFAFRRHHILVHPGAGTT